MCFKIMFNMKKILYIKLYFQIMCHIEIIAYKLHIVLTCNTIFIYYL